MVIKFERIKLALILARQAFGAYKFHIIILTVLGFFGGILGGIGVNALIPLFSFVVGEGNGGTDFISRNIEKFFLFLGIDFSLKFILVFIIIIFVIKAVVSVIFSYFNTYITASYEESVRTRLFEKMTKAQWHYLLDQKLGHLEKILMNNVEQCKNFLALLSIALMVITNLLVYTFVAINISFKITIVTFLLGAILLVIMIPLLKRIKGISYTQEKINRDAAHHINENIMGMKIIKALSTEGFVSNMATRYFREMKEIKIKTNILNTLTGSFIEPATVIFIALIFAISYKTASFEIASLLVLIYVIKQLFVYIRQLQTLVIGVNAYAPYLKVVLNYENQIDNYHESNPGQLPFRFENQFNFEKVAFSYIKEEIATPTKTILKNVSFSLNKGEMIGLIGPSGAGKTTIVDLMLRLFNPTDGKITIDNKEAKEIDLKDWRKKIGYVSQDVFLVNDTVANNIKFYDDSVKNKDVIEALKMSNAYDFVRELPKGLDTIVGERGINLSVGQRQRIAIARVLARKPEILILDEATSSLDNESEKKIKEFIQTLKGKITVFVVAHRLSTVISTDRLLVLEKGEIIEEGKPEELLKDKLSYFYKVYNLK